MSAVQENSRFTNNTGSSILETNLFVQLPIMLNCSALLISRLFFNEFNAFKIFIFEFIVIVLPLILFLTILSDYIYVLYSVYCIIAVSVSIILYFTGDWKTEWKHTVKFTTITTHKLPCISHLRGIINIYSVICILAADFSCFPERFLKTHSFGFSLMDTGVGLYVAAFALANSGNHINSNFTIASSLRRFTPLFLLGIGRYVCISLLNYQHSVSEYGVHWNFFITLSILLLINDFSFHKHTLKLSILILVFYEIVLSAGLKDWILFDSSRTTIISANKEGIFSLVGYEIIYIFCEQIKNILPKSGDSLQNYVNFVKKCLRLWLLFLLLTLISHYTVGVSRRCANCGYVFWITSHILLNLAIVIWIELFIYIFNKKISSKLNLVVPLIVESVNFNGLLFFLLANVITGLINMIFSTLLINTTGSLLIIIYYILFCCTVNVILYHKKRRIR